ncbi:DUF4436 family protein [Iamia majanohamensis]|uniref:DUF4436 family protein n=1 Tax=Iamia majanohamensis TaxID=467976 RepID=A0AAF0BR58_9ACTN|nr:DUF4436 family protein [Iamia majanohamensis]WCO66066.1 DUF4436 family protein [Iamia majanohamensis]
MDPDRPPPPPPSHPGAELPEDAALRRRRAERAREALASPWSASRARHLRIIALVLVVVGPVIGTLFALVLIPAEPSDVVTAEPPDPPLLDATATVRNIDPTTNEMTLRLVLSEPVSGSGSDLEDPGLFDGGVLSEPVAVVVNDSAGENVRLLPGGQAPGSIGLTLPLSSSRVTRYPVDRYDTTLLVQARRGSIDGDPVPVRLTVRSNDPLFTTVATEAEATPMAAATDLRVQRRWTVVGWAVFFVILCWMLAISAASVGWITVVHGLSSPFWCWGFLVGVLFALPPLRTALPGNPPGGSLVDFAAFYWAVGIVALTMVAMIGSWNVRVRRWPDNPDAPRPPI